MDWGECGLGRCAIVGRIPYWGCKSNLCGADLEGGGASNLTGADRGRMWIGAVSPAFRIRNRTRWSLGYRYGRRSRGSFRIPNTKWL